MLKKIKYVFSKGMRILMFPPAINNSTIDSSSKICSGSQINNTVLGKYSYIGYNCFSVDVEIGKFCSIADNCRLGGASHPADWVSSSPVFIKGKNVLKKNLANHKYVATKHTIIENDVWIGAGTQIKSGVRIGTGAIIGMGSIVTKDVPPYTIVAGTPAKIIRKRFDDEICDALLKSKWWDWDDEKIEKYAEYFPEPKVFIDMIENDTAAQ